MIAIYNTNEISNEITTDNEFNLSRFFSVNRYTGNDKFDNGQRIGYGLGIKKKNFKFNIAQGFQISSDSDYTKDVNMDDDLSDVLPVQMGIHTEDFNIDWFTRQTGIEVVGRQIQIFSRKYPFMYCNIDGVLSEPKALLECKHTNAFTNEVKTAEKYKAQLQHYLMIYGASKIYLSIL